MVTDPFRRGVKAAADLIEGGGFNATTTHPYRLDDVILCKLGQTTRKSPRRNTQRIKDPKDAWLRGLAFGLAEMHRQNIAAQHDAGLCRVARSAGLTLAEARRVGVPVVDVNRLARAGIS